MYLVFDTETTGLPPKGVDHTHPSQPHIVQLALILCDSDGREHQSANLLINPGEGVEIPADAARVHGITTERVRREGLPAREALRLFLYMAARAHTLAAHNIGFDWTLVQAGLHRTGLSEVASFLNKKERFCTMKTARDIVRIPPTPKMVRAGFGNQFKNPTVAECVRYFFGEELQNAHDAMADARGTVRILTRILELRNEAEKQTAPALA